MGAERETSFSGAGRDATVEVWVFIIEPRSDYGVEVRYVKRPWRKLADSRDFYQRHCKSIKPKACSTGGF